VGKKGNKSFLAFKYKENMIVSLRLIWYLNILNLTENVEYFNSQKVIKQGRTLWSSPSTIRYPLPSLRVRKGNWDMQAANPFFRDWEVLPSGDYNILSCGRQTVFSVMGVRKGMENFYFDR